ncbi:MAG TPA: hypothetical protein VFK12_00420, partial [Gammaproteobacteria bacterium]|nr:hypothetical protein [Gammaproteobacteria bacterium]
QIVSPQSGGKTIDIPSVPAGKSTYLFEVPAGRYCLQRFSYGNYLISHQGQYVNCFMVPAGEIGFSGMYAPRAYNGQVAVSQDLDVASSQAELKRDYPRIAAQFLRPEPALTPAAETAKAPAQAAATTTTTAPPPPGKDLISSWVEHDKQESDDTIYLRNNTKWALEITVFELYACANIKQTCKPIHPHFTLAPHQTKSFMKVQPDNPYAAYSFHYRLQYNFN